MILVDILFGEGLIFILLFFELMYFFVLLIKRMFVVELGKVGGKVGKGDKEKSGR